MRLSRLFLIQKNRVMRLPNYVRAFGAFWGIRLVFSIEKALPRTSNITNKILGPGFPAPIHLRECISDHAIFWQCLVTRQYDLSSFPQSRRLLEQYKRILNQGRRPIIIDAGGNIGLAAFWFACSFPEACIISVEPEDANFSLLKRNVAVFGDRVRAVHGAVTEAPRLMRITNPNDGFSSFQLSPGVDPEVPAVQGFTITSLAETIANGEIFIVKIDIEGGQRYLFASNTDWVDRVHVIIIEIDDWQFPWQATSEAFFNEVSKRRFDYLIKGENLFCFRHIEVPG
jgi:FkbM family methyltransferase